MTIAAEGGVADRLHMLPPAIPSEMERLAAVYDVGFSGEPGHTANNRIALGNKLFSYLLAGVPIVMSDVPAHRGLAPEIEGAAFLYPADYPSVLAATLDTLLCDPEKLAAARASAFRLGQARFNWDVEKESLLSLVSKAVGA